MLRVWFTASALALASTNLSAQQPLFTSGIDLVHLGVTVVGRDGDPVPDLTVDDFELYEDGTLQEIRYFSRGVASDADTMPLHLGMMFDASVSMELEGRFAKTAAIKFLNTLTYAEDMTLVDFDTEVRVGRYGQDDFARLVERIRNRRPGGMTALYDALGVYLDGAFDQDGRKVLLLYSDGEDTRSRMRFSDVIDLVKASDVTVYAIGLQEHLPRSNRMRRRMELGQLADLTGGRCYFPTELEELDGIYEQIIEELNTRYSLGYVSANDRSDGTWRDVEIKIKESRPALERVKVRSRQGYFAPYIESNLDPAP